MIPKPPPVWPFPTWYGQPFKPAAKTATKKTAAKKGGRK